VLAQLAVFKVRVGANAAFEALMAEAAAEVKAKEPGTVISQTFRSRVDPQEYRTVVVYRDEAAERFHHASAHHAVLAAKLGDLVDPGTTAAFYDAI
jgi:quinol monooxygenase YgiN